MNDIQRLLMASIVIVACIFSSILVIQKWFNLQFPTITAPATIVNSDTLSIKKVDVSFTQAPSISALPSLTITKAPRIIPQLITTKPRVISATTTLTTTASTTPTATASPTKIATTTASVKNTTETIAHNELPDFSNIYDVKQKKKAFFDFMAPMVEAENNKILIIRAKIERLSSLDKLSLSDEQWLKGIKKRYRVKDSSKDAFAELMLKVNIIPPSLAIAQSANESAWASSRFAKLGNNLFGQWCFSKGCGVIPEGRPEGETFEVRQFKSPQHSVASYLLNLNRHYAYADLRQVRLELVQNNKAINGYDLATGLQSYSIRKMEYVKEIQQMIKYNKLLRLDVSQEVFDNWKYTEITTPTIAPTPNVIKPTLTPTATTTKNPNQPI